MNSTVINRWAYNNIGIDRIIYIDTIFPNINTMIPRLRRFIVKTSTILKRIMPLIRPYHTIYLCCELDNKMIKSQLPKANYIALFTSNKTNGKVVSTVNYAYNESISVDTSIVCNYTDDLLFEKGVTYNLDLGINVIYKSINFNNVIKRISEMPHIRALHTDIQSGDYSLEKLTHLHELTLLSHDINDVVNVDLSAMTNLRHLILRFRSLNFKFYGISSLRKLKSLSIEGPLVEIDCSHFKNVTFLLLSGVKSIKNLQQCDKVKRLEIGKNVFVK
jgi:hypothetical protein